MQKRALTTALAFLTFCLASNTEAGQIGEKPQNHTTNIDSGEMSAESPLRFDRVFANLSQKYHVSLICESRPLLLTPKDAEAAKALEQVLSHPNSDVDEQVKAVAAAFDYQATRADRGKDKTLFLLTKRYTSPSDLPEVTLEEADTSFRNILRATQRFASQDSGPSGLIVKLLTGAAPEQRALFAKGIPASDLSAAQKSVAWELASSGEAGIPLSHIQTVGNRLAGLRRGTASLGTSDYAGLTLPCYQGGFGPHDENWKVYLSYWVRTTSGGGSVLPIPPGAEYANGKITGVPPDPTVPGKTPEHAPETLAFQKTLAQAAAMITGKLIASDSLFAKSGITRIEADPAIARKTVCVFGESLLSPEQMLGAVTDLYQLRAPKVKDGVVQITLPTPKSLEKGSEIPAEVRRLLPPSFVRAIVAGPHFVFAGKTVDDKPADLANLEYPAADRLYLAAIKRLRAIAEPKIDEAREKTVLFRDIPPEAGDLAALSSLATCYGEIRLLSTPKNPLLDNMDKAVFTASIEKGRAVYSILFMDGDGKQQGLRGDLPIPVPSPN